MRTFLSIHNAMQSFFRIPGGLYVCVEFKYFALATPQVKASCFWYCVLHWLGLRERRVCSAGYQTVRNTHINTTHTHSRAYAYRLTHHTSFITGRTTCNWCPGSVKGSSLLHISAAATHADHLSNCRKHSQRESKLCSCCLPCLC